MDYPSTETILQMTTSELYELLRKIARARLLDQEYTVTLDTEDLVHEYTMKFMGALDEAASTDDRRALIRCAGFRMRQLLIDAGRKRHALKRDAGCRPVSLALTDAEGRRTRQEIDLEALKRAMATLEQESPEHANVLNALYFAGVTRAELAEMLGIDGAEIEKLRKQAKRRLESLLPSASEVMK